MISSTKTSFCSPFTHDSKGADGDGRNYKWKYNKKNFLCCAAIRRMKTDRKNVRKSYYIHTQFFNILFQFFILLKTYFLCCVSSTTTSLMISLSGRSWCRCYSFFSSIPFLYIFALFIWFKKREIVFLYFSFLILRSYKFWLSKHWARQESEEKISSSLMFSWRFLLIDCFCAHLVRLFLDSAVFLPPNSLRSQCYHIAYY